MAIEKILSTKNIENVVKHSPAAENTYIDTILSDAYKCSVENAEHVENVMKELDNTAREVITENPESPETKLDNIYTKKHVLDESMDDFSLSDNSPKKVYDDDAMDTYWDMDMFDFIYELVSISDARRKPIDPLGRPHARFAVSGRDKYAGLTPEQAKIEKAQEAEVDVERAMLGSPQVAAMDDYIDVYAHNLFRFDDIKEICNLYHFKTEGPKETYKKRRNKFLMPSKDEWMQYEYYFRIYVPTEPNGLFYRIDDYFETIGKTLEDVMNPEFCKHYRKIEARLEKEAEELLAKKQKEREKARARKAVEDAELLNSSKVEEIYKKHSTRAGQSNDPLEGFIEDMFNELDSTTLDDGTKLKYSKSQLKARFLSDFDDDFEDDIDEGLLDNPVMSASPAGIVSKLFN